jgi:hypothetical protein
MDEQMKFNCNFPDLFFTFLVDSKGFHLIHTMHCTLMTLISAQLKCRKIKLTR